MRWRRLRKSENVEDRRGMTPGKAMAGGGIGVIIMAVIVMLMGGDPTQLIGGLEETLGQAGGSARAGGGAEAAGRDDEFKEMVAAVLGSTEDVWNPQFARLGQAYREPDLVLFEQAVQSACGFQQAAVGPFYCPGDSTVYLDESFFHDLANKLDAPGDFAQAYVIAHEVGHHVQNLQGVSRQVQQLQRGMSEVEANDLSVRLELQADFYAGLWAHHADSMDDILEAGDIDEALNAASQIGDDRLQMRSKGYVAPDSFTHGSSAQRMRWFRRGFETGDYELGNTFQARDL